MMLFLFFFSLCNAQKLYIQDSIDGSPVKYAKIIINEKIFYSDSLGEIRNEMLIDSIIRIEKSGFESKTILLSSLTNKILLSPKYTLIEDVIIYPQKNYTIATPIKRSNTTKFPDGLEIGFIIKNKYLKEGYINGIDIPIKKNSYKDGFLIINFHSVDISGQPKETILNKEPIVISLKGIKDVLEVKFDEKNVLFPVNGVLISVRIVSEIGTIKDNVKYPIIEFFNGKSKESVFFRKVDKWEKFQNDLNSIGFSLNIRI